MRVFVKIADNREHIFNFPTDCKFNMNDPVIGWVTIVASDGGMKGTFNMTHVAAIVPLEEKS